MNIISIMSLIGLLFCGVYALVVDARARARQANLVGRNKDGTFKEQNKTVVQLNWIVDVLVTNRWRGGVSA